MDWSADENMVTRDLQEPTPVSSLEAVVGVQ